MIAEIGHYALFLALALAIAAATLPLVGAARGDGRLIALASPLAMGQFAFAVVAFAALTVGYVLSDFSIVNVALNSHTEKPMIYKISGVWGNHEGSLVLWVLMLTLFAAAVAAFGGNLPAPFRARVLAVQAMIAIGFLAFLLFTSNPFLRLDPAPVQGQGLNPLLQDPGLAFHPPLLYLGYVGFSVAFSFAVAALIEGRVGPAWARWVRPWTLVAWVFLTGGIALGSWWAYYELGWGGWWFWDPVENASLMPWLAGTALLHSAIVVEKRDTLKSWTVLLAILTFSLSLLGTFLVRSGVLTSVHAFAVDPARGVFILGFLVLVVGGSLTLYAARAHALNPGGVFSTVSREGGLVVNNLLLTVLTASVLVGTLYPLLLDALTGQKVSVGPPYFNLVTLVLGAPLILAMAVGPWLSWKRARLRSALAGLTGAGVAAGVAALLVGWRSGGEPLLAVAGFALAIWLAGGVILELAERTKLGRAPLATVLARAGGLPRAAWGMSVAHFGMAVMIVGITASEAWTTEQLVVMRPGETVDVAGYAFRLDGVEPIAGANYTAMQGHFSVTRDGRAVAALVAEDRIYTSPFMQTTEAGIRPLMIGDLYAVIGEPDGTGGWSARLYLKPLVSWIWGGALIMMLGGTLSLSDRRLRVGAPRRTAASRGGPRPAAQPAE